MNNVCLFMIYAMTADTPLDIRRFELLQIISIFVGLIHEFATFDGDLFGAVFNVVLMMVLTLLVSRKRKNWARWTLAVMFVLGGALMFWLWEEVLSMGYPAVTLAVTLMQALAIALLFTKQSSIWLRRRPLSAAA